MSGFIMLMRREVWEHRALWVVPSVVALLIVVSALVAVGVTESWRGSTTVRVITTSGHEQAIEHSQEKIGRLAKELAAVASGLAAERKATALEQAARDAEEQARKLEESLRDSGPDADPETQRRVEEAAAAAQQRALTLERLLESTADTPAPPASPAPPQPPSAEAPAPPAPAAPASRRAEIERLRAAISEEARVIAENEQALRRSNGETAGNGTQIEINGMTLGELLARYSNVDTARAREVAGELMFTSAGLFFVITVWIVFFYALASLYDERKDRSALFWKSLPVSDLTTVGSKTATALITAPLFAFAAAVVTQLALMIMASLVVFQSDLDVWRLVWSAARPWVVWPQMLASFLVQALWLAPVIGWALLVSAWARRMPVLYALLVPAVIALMEYLMFRSQVLMTLIGERLSRGVLVVVDSQTTNVGDVAVTSTIRSMDIDSIVKMLTMPSFWIGLAVAAVFIAAAVWIRRYRDEG